MAECLLCVQVTVQSDMSVVSVTWAARGDSADEQIAALLPTFASQLRFANAIVQVHDGHQLISNHIY